MVLSGGGGGGAGGGGGGPGAVVCAVAPAPRGVALARSLRSPLRPNVHALTHAHAHAPVAAAVAVAAVATATAIGSAEPCCRSSASKAAAASSSSMGAFAVLQQSSPSAAPLAAASEPMDTSAAADAAPSPHREAGTAAEGAAARALDAAPNTAPTRPTAREPLAHVPEPAPSSSSSPAATSDTPALPAPATPSTPPTRKRSRSRSPSPASRKRQCVADIEQEQQQHQHQHRGPPPPADSTSSTSTLPTSSSSSSSSSSLSSSPSLAAAAAAAATSSTMAPDWFDCPVCCALLCQPVTTGCGHTFCRSCLLRATANSPACPMCRRPIHVDASTAETVVLAQALARAWPQEYQQRLAELGPASGKQHFIVPLLCIPALLFPGMVMPLHLFETADKLVLQRALEASGVFGVVATPSNPGEGEYDIGTLAAISSHVRLPDGRSLVSTRGSQRFRILERRIDSDGCQVAMVERVLDKDAASPDELAAEADEIAALVHAHFGSLPESIESNEICSRIRTFLQSTPSVEQLFSYLKDRIRSKSGPALPIVEQKFGALPDRDPVAFSFWVSSLLPITLKQKQELLRISSTRLRLAMAVVLCK